MFPLSLTARHAIDAWPEIGPTVLVHDVAYLGAVLDGLAGVEAARVVLAGVVRRLEG